MIKLVNLEKYYGIWMYSVSYVFLKELLFVAEDYMIIRL